MSCALILLLFCHAVIFSLVTCHCHIVMFFSICYVALHGGWLLTSCTVVVSFARRADALSGLRVTTGISVA